MFPSGELNPLIREPFYRIREDRAVRANLAFSPIGSAIVVRQRFFGIFWPLFLAGSEPNRRMTDAAHNQHSETRRLSDRDDCGEQKARRALSLRRTPRASEPSGSRWATPRGPENGAGPCDPGSGGDRGERGEQCGRRPKGPLSRARVCVGGGGLPKSRVKPANLRWRPWMFLSSGRLLFVCLSRTGRLPSAICNAGRPPRRDARRVHPAI